MDAPCYIPSGKFRLLRFPAVLVGTLAVAAFLGALMFLLYRAGHYYVFVMPMFFAAATCGIVVLGVHAGHIRNRKIGLGLGLLAGVVLYFAQYQALLIDLAGWQFAHRIDVLPRLVAWRMEVDRVRDTSDVRESDAGDEPASKVDQVLNWLLFVLELAVCVSAPAWSGRRYAGRAYCETCRKWTRKHRFAFPPACGRDIVEAFETQNVQRIADLPTAQYDLSQAQTLIILDCCARPAASTSCAVYATICERQPGKAGSADGFRSDGKRLTWRQQILTPEQIDAFAGLLPVLAPWALGTPRCPTRPAPAADEAHRQTDPSGDLAARIHIEAAPAPMANLVLTRRHRWRAAWLHFAPLLVALAPIAVLIVATIVLTGESGTFQQLSPESLGGWTAFALGIVGLFGALWWIPRHRSSWRDRYLYRLTRAVLRARPQRWVDPDDPRALFVELVPRENWMKLFRAADVGFVRLCAESDALLFEGDANRYRIPMRALVRPVREMILDIHGNPILCAVMVAAADGTTKLELPLVAHGPPWRSGIRAGAARAEELLAAILMCLGQAVVDAAAQQGVDPQDVTGFRHLSLTPTEKQRCSSDAAKSPAAGSGSAG